MKSSPFCIAAKVVRSINSTYLESGFRFFYHFSNIDDDIFCVPDGKVVQSLREAQGKWNLRRDMIDDIIEIWNTEKKRILVVSIVTGRWSLITLDLPQKQEAMRSKGFKR